MRALKRHPLVKADLKEAFDYYEGRRPGLGRGFALEFRRCYLRLRDDALRHAFRFGRIRRVNLKRFPYGLFYVAGESAVWVLAVLHARRDHRLVLERRARSFPEAESASSPRRD